MAIFVDRLRDYRAITGRGVPGLWCHMVSDSGLDELHQFAARIGVSRRLFQDHPRHPHYDLLPASRSLAVAMGAIEVSTRELARIVQGENGRG